MRTDRPVSRLALLIAGTVLASCSSTPPMSAAPAAGGRYVALGSSFAAGAGLAPVSEAGPERCGRSLRAYPTLLAEKLKLDLVNASCGGATTAHVLGPWDELPAQIDAVTRDTALVTVTVGGNDLDYMGRLFAGSCAAEATRNRLVNDPPEQCRPLQVPSEADYTRLRADFEAMLQRIAMQAPDARMVVVQYVTLVSDQPCDAAPLAADDARTLRQIGERLAEISAAAAVSAGADILAADTLSQSHTPCDRMPWSLAPSASYVPEMGAPWHPNAAGHAAIAQALGDLLRS